MRTACLVSILVCVASSAHGQPALSVYISADMEGVAALSATDDPAGRRLMTAEVNAAIAGAFDAGAVRVVVNDAHGGHDNLIAEELDPRVTFLRGDLKPYGMMQGLDSSFTAVVFIGFHGKANAPGGFAAHTGSGRTADLRIDGVSVGEAGMNALYAAWYGVPVAFVSGDSLAIAELRALAPEVRGVAVKRGIWNQAVHTLTPDSARAAIRRGTASALRRIPTPSLRPQPPIEVEFRYSNALYADVAEGIPAIRRVDTHTVAFETADYPAAYRMVRVLYKHLTP